MGNTNLNIAQNPEIVDFVVKESFFSKINRQFVIIDVGARNGAKEYWKRLHKEAKIIGFDVDSKEVERLNMLNFESNQIYYSYALHHKNEKLPFYLTKKPGWSSFNKPNNIAVERFDLGDFLTVIDEVLINTISLDNFVDDYNIGEVDFIKLDTEGSEFDIIQGAEETLKRTLGLELEYRFNSTIPQPGAMFHVIDKYLQEKNFMIYDICIRRRTKAVPNLKTQNQEFDKGQAIGGDVLYIRDAVFEITNEENLSFWTPEKILKLAVVYDIYEQQDSALELILFALNRNLLGDFSNHPIVDCLRKSNEIH